MSANKAAHILHNEAKRRVAERQKRAKTCPSCKGRKYVGVHGTPCTRCDGSGEEIEMPEEHKEDWEMSTEELDDQQQEQEDAYKKYDKARAKQAAVTIQCATCGGNGTIDPGTGIPADCPDCKGAGLVPDAVGGARQAMRRVAEHKQAADEKINLELSEDEFAKMQPMLQQNAILYDVHVNHGAPDDKALTITIKASDQEIIKQFWQSKQADAGLKDVIPMAAIPMAMGIPPAGEAIQEYLDKNKEQTQHEQVTAKKPSLNERGPGISAQTFSSEEEARQLYNQLKDSDQIASGTEPNIGFDNMWIVAWYN